MPLQADRRYSFGGGLNTNDNPTSIQPDELSDVRNYGYDITGALVTRGGQAHINSTPADANTVTSLVRFYLRSGTKHTVFFRNQTMYRQTGVDGTSIDSTAFTANSTFTFATFNDILYYSNGVDTTSSQTMRKWTGSGSASAPSASPAQPCRYLLASTKMQRLLATGADNATDTLYGSALGDGEDWTTANNAFTLAVRTFKGDKIVGIVEISAGIIVFKQSSIHLVTGNDPQNLAVTPLSLETGCSSPRSISSNQRSAFWYYNGYIYECDGAQVYRVSRKITPTLGAMISPTNWVGVVYKDQYRLHVTASGSTNNRVLVYYFNQPASDNRRPFTHFDTIAVSSATILHGENGELYTGSYTGYVNQQDTTTQDFGTDITAYGVTGWQFLSQPERRKKFKRLWVITKPTGAYTLRIYTSWDGVDNSTTYDSISLATSTPSLDIDFQLDVSGLDGGSADFITEDISPVRTARSVKYKFYCVGPSYIYGYSMIDRKKRIR